jgi:hypothetical protein
MAWALRACCARLNLPQPFPRATSWGLPDRSCALAISATLSAAELADVTNLVDNCYARATIPMRPGIFQPSDLLERAD